MQQAQRPDVQSAAGEVDAAPGAGPDRHAEPTVPYDPAAAGGGGSSEGSEATSGRDSAAPGSIASP